MILAHAVEPIGGMYENQLRQVKTMENPEVKRFLEARAKDARVHQARQNISCDSCMAQVIADFDFEPDKADAVLINTYQQAFMWSDGSERYLLSVMGEWVAAFITGCDILIDVSRKYRHKLGDVSAVVYEFANRIGEYDDVLEWRVIQ